MPKKLEYDLQDLNENHEITITEIKKKLGEDKYLAVIELSKKEKTIASTRKRRRSSKRIAYEEENVSESDSDYHPEIEPAPRRITPGKSKLLRTSTRPSSGEDDYNNEDDFINDEESDVELPEDEEEPVVKKKQKEKVSKRKTRSATVAATNQVPRHSSRIDRVQSKKEKKASLFEQIKTKKKPELKEDLDVLIDSEEEAAIKRKKLKRVVNVIQSDESDDPEIEVQPSSQASNVARAPESRRKTPRKKMVIEDDDEQDDDPKADEKDENVDGDVEKEEKQDENGKESEPSESESEEEQQVAKYKVAGMRFFQKLSLEEAFDVFINIYLNAVYDPQLLKTANLMQLDRYEEIILPALNKVDDSLRSKMNLSTSMAWCKKFRNALEKYPLLKMENYGSDWSRDDCQACNRTNRPWSVEFTFSGAPYDRVTMEDIRDDEVDDEEDEESDDSTSDETNFRLGCFCADRASAYHDLCHFKYDIMITCRKKISESPKTDKQDVINSIMVNKGWIDLEFRTFESILKAPEKFLEDSPNKRRWKAR